MTDEIERILREYNIDAAPSSTQEAAEAIAAALDMLFTTDGKHVESEQPVTGPPLSAPPR